MYDHFEGDGRQVVAAAQAQARRLGHGFIGSEHLLCGLAADAGPVGALLRSKGATPDRCEAELVRLIASGRGPGRGPGADALDRDALGSLGIDLDTVRERVESVFGPGALTAAAVRPLQSRRPAWLHLHHRTRPGSGSRSRSAPRLSAPARPVPGHLPLTRRAAACLARSLEQARSAHTGYLGADHIALELFTQDPSLPRRILAGLNLSVPDLRADLVRLNRPGG